MRFKSVTARLSRSLTYAIISGKAIGVDPGRGRWGERGREDNLLGRVVERTASTETLWGGWPYMMVARS